MGNEWDLWKSSVYARRTKVFIMEDGSEVSVSQTVSGGYQATTPDWFPFSSNTLAIGDTEEEVLDTLRANHGAIKRIKGDY
jgi:hypothetical protein